MELNGQNSSPLLATSQAKDKFVRYPWKRSLRMRLFNNRRFRRILYGTLIFVILLFTLVFIVVPFAFRYSYTLQRSFLFLNFVNNASNIEVPTKHGLVGARNLYVESEDGVRLGTWHILPSSKLPELLVQGLLTTTSIDDIYDNHLRSGDPIIIYLHGNAGNRAASHRLGIYKVLQRNNYHVIAFDYRSYGDSSPVSPNEQGVVNDAKAIYAWVKRIAPKSNVFIWGHSLGTGVASHCIYELEGEGKKTTGVVLEAPFTNLQDELRDYPMTGLFQRLPWFDFFFVDPMYDNNFRFASDLYLMNVTAPVLILHAEDDVVVPLHLGRRLYEKIKDNRGPGKEDTIKFIDFPKNRRLGHQDIYRDSSLPQIVSNFITTNLKHQ